MSHLYVLVIFVVRHRTSSFNLTSIGKQAMMSLSKAVASGKTAASNCCLSHQWLSSTKITKV